MAKSKKARNHYVPRFLLKRFASRIENEKSWVWQYSQTQIPIEISTKDGGVAKYFYGREPGLEDALSVLEAETATAISHIENGSNPNDHKKILNKFAYISVMRTRATRSAFSSVIGRLLKQTSLSLVDTEVQDDARKHARAIMPDLIEEELSKLPAEQRKLAFAMLHSKAGRRLQEGVIQNIPDSMRKLSDNLLEFDTTSKDSKVATNAQVTGLERLIGNLEAPQKARFEHWQVLSFNTENLILGDAIVVPASKNYMLAPFFSGDTMEIEYIFLPVTKNSALCGSRTNATISLSADLLNEMSAKISASHYFSWQDSTETRELLALIGTQCEILSDDALERITKNAFRENA